MLREASITYSSVPQDEDSSSQSAFVTTRHANKPHDQRDCHLTAIITSLVIICGVSLAVILPLALQYRSDATGRGEILQHLTGELGNNSKNTDQEGNVNNKLSGPASHTIESNIENSTTKTTEKPAGGGKVGTEGIGDAGQASGSSVIVGKGNGSQETPNPPLSNTEAPIKNDTKEAILDAIYGKNDTSRTGDGAERRRAAVSDVVVGGRGKCGGDHSYHLAGLQPHHSTQAQDQHAAGISPHGIAGVSLHGIADDSPSSISGLSPCSIAGLSPHGIPGVSPHGIADFSPCSIAGVSPNGIAGLSPHGIAGLIPHGIAGFSPHGIPGVSPHGIADLSPCSIAGISPCSIAGVSPSSIAGLSPHGIAGVSPSSIAGLSPHGIAGVSPSSIAGLSPHGIAGVSLHGIAGFSSHDIADDSPSSISGFCPHSIAGSIITDLQSRDKVVLLNSEESEEE
ncbi:Receptor-like protein 34-like [Homarus americanus]|uniref:Receptor-like protein 34-like n=1 Tax=Homarus americanus TaxID=6706 RepID=A0A8J5KNC3_HOMAM|nr:Receptor-like protein 34-like [Homarus americanus]